MPRYKMTVAYDGTNYAGWQVQPKADTIQSMLQNALKCLAREPILLHGSGRTDQGVHARAQVAHWDQTTPVADVRSLQYRLNGILPPDIRVNQVRKAAPDFHARHSARGKEYRYFIWNGPVVPPWLHNYRTHIRHPLDAEAMRKAAALLEGRHDFSAFSANPSRHVESHIRTIYHLRVCKKGPELVLKVRGDGFLYKMVRSLAGHLIRVGAGEVPWADTTGVLESHQRTAHVPTAAAGGLFLWQVFY